MPPDSFVTTLFPLLSVYSHVFLPEPSILEVLFFLLFEIIESIFSGENPRSFALSAPCFEKECPPADCFIS